MPKSKFPKTILVTREGDKGDEYLSVREDASYTGIDDTTPVAVYQLVEVGKVVVTREFKTSQRRADTLHRSE